MLSKLMKHELKATSRLLVPLYLILLVLSIVNRFVSIPNMTSGSFNIIDQFITTIYVMSIFAVFTVTSVYMVIRFYKNLLTDEGYLMFTLPVKPHHHITSKLLITLFWIVVSVITVLLSALIVFATSDALPDVIRAIGEAISELNAYFGARWIFVAIELFIMGVLVMVGGILMIYVSIALGQLFSKHKIIASFVAYAILYTAIQFLMITVVATFGGLAGELILQKAFIPNVVLPVGIVLLALGCAAAFLTTNHIFTRKLNLD